MRLFQRARSSYALSLILCAVLLGAMAVPAFASDEGRGNRAAQAEKAQAKKDKKERQDKEEAQRAEAAEQSSSSSSSSASSRGESASAAKSSNASSQGQSASAGKSSNASAKSEGHSSAAARSDNGEKPAKAAKQDSGEAKAAGENSPAGNKGSMKVRPVGTAAHPPRNYAHLPCTVQVDFYGSPHSGATLTAVSHAPTAPTGQTLLTETMTFSQPSPNPRGNELVGTTTLDFTSVVSGLTYHEQQGYHVKLTAVQDGPQGGDVKHKVFWIDCPPAAPTADAQPGSTGESIEQNDTTTADVASQVEVEREVVGQVQGLSGQERTEVRGVTVDREAVAAVEGRVLGESGAAAAVAGSNARALAATGVGVLTLALLGLFGLGGGAGMLRRFRKR